MAGIRVRVQGADRLADTAGRAAGRMRNLTEPNRAAAAAIRAGAHPPRRTGYLAASATVQAGPRTAVLAWTAPYASFVYYGTRNMPARPWAEPFSDAAIVRPYLDHAERTLREMKGA